jgi:hypothetical protein
VDPASLPRRTMPLHGLWQALKRTRLPIALVQLMLILGIFALFLWGVNLYLERNPRAVPRQPRNSPRSSAVKLAETGRAATNGQAPQAPQVQKASLPDGAGQAATLTAPQIAASPNLSEPFDQAVASSPFTTGVYALLPASSRIGQRFELICRIVNVSDDAAGQICNSFELNGRPMRLSPDDEQRYRRLEIVDLKKHRCTELFIDGQGPFAQHLDWILPHDYLRLVVTPGVRFDRFSDRMDWGLIVLEIQPALPEG